MAAALRILRPRHLSIHGHQKRLSTAKLVNAKNAGTLSACARASHIHVHQKQGRLAAPLV